MNADRTLYMRIDALVKSRKTARSSFRRKPESSISKMFWTPAFVGVTGLCLLLGIIDNKWLPYEI